MKNHSMLTHFFFIFFLFFIFHHITVATSTPPYIAVDNITLDCGSFGNSKATDKRDWIGDIGSKYGPMEQNNEYNSSEAQRQASSVEFIPYSTARLSYSQFTYVFPVTPGPKFVRLYFYSAAYSGFPKSKDFFTVKAGSFTLLRNFSTSIYTDSSDKKYFVKEFCINVEKNKKLNLTFIPFTSGSISYYAFINGIEVVSMPMDLYYTSSSSIREGKVPVYVGQAPRFYINYSMALEMVYRLNIGGRSISPMEDTGLFRQWYQSRTDYLLSDGVNPHDPSLEFNYSKIPKYIAPEDVYRTAASMGPNRTRNSMSNLTWGLPVETGFNYLVRLHFCEIDPGVHVSGTRVFTIYVDYQLAEEADVVSWADNSYTPYYKDYVVMIQNKGEDSHTLAIDLHPGTDATLRDAILNGVEVFKLSDPSGNLARLNMVPPPLVPPPLAANKSKTKKTMFTAIGSGVGFLVVAALVCFMVLRKLRKTERYGSYHPLAKWWCWFRPDPYKREFSRRTASSLPGELCRYFRLDEIKTATNNFNEDLIVGVGGFGNVYKGLIEQGNIVVAIKRMKQESRQGAHEFMTEIEMLSKLRHVHLVSLIGYCNDESEMILVYEYMTNGTLRHHLYDTPNDPLTWKQRLQICIGAARGLHYLHTCTKHPIIHRDVKTTNILLDEKWVAKVSDFGLSKMGLDNTAVSTLVKGTWGYLDPDYARRQQLTEKSDVYSFGVVMFEVLCARKALNQRLQEEERNLASWARKCIERGTFSEIIDPYLTNKIAPECFKVYVELAESCVSDHGIERPKMNDVMEKLEFALELQEYAEATKDTNSEVVSFCVATANGAPWHNSVYHGQVLESSSGTELSTISTGLSYPGLDSITISITSQDDSSATKNSSS